MSTRLSTKLSRMSIEELAHEYVMADLANRDNHGNAYSKFSLMALTQYSIREEMIGRTGKERTDQAITNARNTLKMVGIIR